MVFSLVLTRTVTFCTKVAWTRAAHTHTHRRQTDRTKASHLLAMVWKEDGLDLVSRRQVVRGAMGFEGFEQAEV